ncbi:MAG: hypothetical protein ACFFHV_12340 [Promethearchaeota archaeon]
MRNKRVYYVIITTILIIFPILNSVNAVAEGADYIGIKKNDEFIWNIKYDEEVDKQMGHDMGINTTTFSWDEDYKSIKAVITWIGEETTFGGEKGIKFKWNQYKSKKSEPIYEEKDWKSDHKGREGIILKYVEGDKDILYFYESCAIYGALFVANNVDWKEVMHELNDDLQKGHYGSASYRRSLFYPIILDEGMSITFDGEGHLGKRFISIHYTKDGFLKSFKLSYVNDDDLDDVISISLQNSIWIEYWLHIICMIVAIGAIVITVIYFKLVRKKRPTLKEKPEMDEPIENSTVN